MYFPLFFYISLKINLLSKRNQTLPLGKNDNDQVFSNITFTYVPHRKQTAIEQNEK